MSLYIWEMGYFRVDFYIFSSFRYSHLSSSSDFFYSLFLLLITGQSRLVAEVIGSAQV